ncbi:MAG: primosomal protein N', partial [Lachnospiraceae bacterium]|nr:primosomal protein N' [Lachnospiraceae bacterium]
MTAYLYANIIVDIVHENVDRPFQYKIPEFLQEHLDSGVCVKIPFGKSNRQINGIILELTNKSDYPQEKLKEIISLAETGAMMSNDAIKLA